MSFWASLEHTWTLIGDGVAPAGFGASDVIGAAAGVPPPEHPVATRPAATTRASDLPRTG